MEISRETMIKIVKATRLSLRVVEAFEMLMPSTPMENVPDWIAGNLMDALFEMCGENLRSDQDFEKDSKTMKILLSEELADDEATDEFIRMAWENARPKPPMRMFVKVGNTATAVKTPSRLSWSWTMADQVGKTGGYCPETGYVPPKETDETPEGEWR